MPLRRRAGTTLVISIMLVLSSSVATAGPNTTTELASRTNAGEPADGDSELSFLSANGRFVVFYSRAANLPGGVGGTTTLAYIYDAVRDTIRVVSKTNDGEPAWGAEPIVSSDGRHVVFRSLDAGLPFGDGLVLRVYVHDRQTGKTRIASVNSDGEPAPDSTGDAFISGNGRWVTFNALSSNLPQGDGMTPQVYLHDRVTGRTRIVSVDAGGTAGDDASGSSSLSSDGRLIAFNSRASNMPKANGDWQVYVYDRISRKTRLISKTSDGEPADGAQFGPRISGDGATVVFWSDADNLPKGDGVTQQVYAHDLDTGRTTLASRRSGGAAGDHDSVSPAVSGDGRYVVFQSRASNLPFGDVDRRQIYLHDRRTGRTILLSRNRRGAPSNGNSFEPAISADGMFATFEGYGTNMPGGDLTTLRIYRRGPLP